MSEFTREQIIEAAKHCSKVFEDKNCECTGCPFDFDVSDCSVCISVFAHYIAESQKEEPATAEAETSSQNNISINRDNTELKTCQAVIKEAKMRLCEIYENLSNEGIIAFELGELFNLLEGEIDKE